MAENANELDSQGSSKLHFDTEKDATMEKKHFSKLGNLRRPFTADEDALLMKIMSTNRFVNWTDVAIKMKSRTARQCRERWINYLNPYIRIGPWTYAEDIVLLDKVNKYGKCWSKIACFFNGRAENDLKNRWYSHLVYEIVKNPNGSYSFPIDASQLPYPDRKKRNRKKISPAQNALKTLEMQKQMEQTQNSQNDFNFNNNLSHQNNDQQVMNQTNEFSNSLQVDPPSPKPKHDPHIYDIDRMISDLSAISNIKYILQNNVRVPEIYCRPCRKRFETGL